MPIARIGESRPQRNRKQTQNVLAKHGTPARSGHAHSQVNAHLDVIALRNSVRPRILVEKLPLPSVYDVVRRRHLQHRSVGVFDPARVRSVDLSPQVRDLCSGCGLRQSGIANDGVVKVLPVQGQRSTSLGYAHVRYRMLTIVQYMRIHASMILSMCVCARARAVFACARARAVRLVSLNRQIARWPILVLAIPVIRSYIGVVEFSKPRALAWCNALILLATFTHDGYFSL